MSPNDDCTGTVCDQHGPMLASDPPMDCPKCHGTGISDEPPDEPEYTYQQELEDDEERHERKYRDPDEPRCPVEYDHSERADYVA